MIVVLAGSYREATRYAAAQGLKLGQMRYASSADTIRGLRVTEIHELASFSRRRDRHAIEAAVRYAVRYGHEAPTRIVADDAAAPVPAEPTDEGQVPGQMRLGEALDGSNASEPEPKPAAKPKRKPRPKPQPQKTAAVSQRPAGDDFFGGI